MRQPCRTIGACIMILVTLQLVSRQCRAFQTTGRQQRLQTRLFSTSDDANKSANGGGRVSNAVKDKDLANKSTANSNNNIKQQLVDLEPPKGTRDFYPENMRLQTWLFTHWRNVAASFGFSEYDAPVLEHESLYTRKAGEEVTQQLYNFLDKGERAVALRPEMTPSLARMVLKKQASLPLPLKWFAIPQCWRYERMTRGRRREHYQWNMDIWGVESVQAEAELLKGMTEFFSNVGLTSKDVGIKVNSRLLIGQVLQKLNVPEQNFAATCVLIDKLEKVPIEAVSKELKDLGLTDESLDFLLKITTCKSLDEIKVLLGDDSDGVKQLQELLDLCEAYGISDWMVLDTSVVRGLAYYTGIVFEAFDRQGQLRAIAGGGRYDNLLSTFGSSVNIPAVGFGFGDAVIVELLSDRGLLPDMTSSTGIETVVVAMSPDLYPAAIKTATLLRSVQNVDLVLENKKLKWVFKHADRLGAKYCIVIGPDEYATNSVAVKDLQSSTQETVSMDNLVEWMSSRS